VEQHGDHEHDRGREQDHAAGITPSRTRQSC
jgi:hypothetical protein